jgi:1-aminocyclopropane-1-carboxylate deaminase/D-cysteine desulfhydrase-like pyridoxal-dependent ACC family enzyme
VVGFEAVCRSRGFHCHPQIWGISVYQPREPATVTVRQRVRETVELLEMPDAKLDEQVVVTDSYLGGGYGEPTDAMIEAVTLAARLEGLLIDPVYTGKTLSGLIDYVRRGTFKKNESVVFWHTGGTAALFAYREAFAATATAG